MASPDEIQFKLREEARLRQERAPYEARWNNIRRFIYPDAGQISLGMPNDSNNRGDILDNTAEDAMELAAAGLHGLLTNPATVWFHLSLLDASIAERDGPARWLEEATRRVNNLFGYAPARFNVASFACYKSAVAFGNWCMFVEERMGDLPLCRSVGLGQIVWDVDDEDTIVRAFRTFHRPLWAIHRKWKGRLPKRLAKLYEDKANWSKRIKLMHVVEPREFYDAKIYNAKNLPFSSCWIDVEGAEEISEGGYHEMPYICGRWATVDDEIYARGCGDKALPDTALLQSGTKSLYNAAEIVSEPPMLAPDEGLKKRLNLRRRAINYIRRDMLGRDEHPRPLLTGARVDITEELLESVRQRIKRAFLKDLLQIIRDPDATATQVLEIREEQMRGMSPVLAHVTQDWLSPVVVRVFGCAQRAGAFRDMPPPREIVGMAPRPVFVSPAARAQQVAEARGVAQAFEAAAQVIQADPDTLDNADLDRSFRLVFKAVGTPLSVLRSPEEIAKRRQARMQVREQAQREESLKNVSTAAKNAAPALKVLAEQQERVAA